MSPQNKTTRHGMTMLEIIVASTMMVVVLASVTLLLRTSRDSWSARSADYHSIQSGHAALRHLVRQARQAVAVTSISGVGDTSGAVSLSMSNGETWVWDHDSATDKLNFGVTTASNLLAENIATFEVAGYEADGVTAASAAADVHVLDISITVDLPRDTGGTKQITSRVWIRSW